MNTQRWTRPAIAGLGIALFAFAAFKLAPFRSQAEPGPLHGSMPPAPAEGPARELGQLVGRDFRLLAIASPLGPRYTVLAPDGQVLAVNCSAEDVSREFPGLEMDTMTADAPIDGRLERQWGE